ncbi:Bug family tripartite tricarboxylate transporter substrate binding protein [Cupriavidus basilensis]
MKPDPQRRHVLKVACELPWCSRRPAPCRSADAACRKGLSAAPGAPDFAPPAPVVPTTSHLGAFARRRAQPEVQATVRGGEQARCRHARGQRGSSPVPRRMATHCCGVAAPFAINAAAGLSQHYDIHKDFVAVGPRVLGPVFLIVNADSPVRTVADFVRMAREKKDGVTFASPGVGSGPHLTAELFAAQAKFKGLNVHYRGDSPPTPSCWPARVDATLTAIDHRAAVYQGWQAARDRGVRGAAHAGLSGRAHVWRAGIPRRGRVRLVRPDGARRHAWRPWCSNSIATPTRVLADAQMRSKLLGLGLQAEAGDSASFARFIDAEVAKWGPLIRSAGIKLE